MADQADSAARSGIKISVVTACYNSAATIGRTIKSFLAQTHPFKELLIIDGASSDRTLEIARGFAHPGIRIVSEKDRGIYDAMNKGLRLYTGDAVGFLNSDDTFHDPTTLARIAAGLEKVEAVHGDVVIVKDHETKRPVRSWRGGPFKAGQFRQGWMPPHPAFYMRRALAARTGDFDLSYASAADYDHMLRALELHARSSAYIAGPMVDFLAGGRSSGLTRVVLANVACLRSRRKHLGGPILDWAFFLKPGLKIFSQHHFWGRIPFPFPTAIRKR